MMRRPALAPLALVVTALLGPGLASSGHAAPPITAAAFTPEGKAVVLGSQAGLALHSWPDLKLLRRLDTDLPHIHALAFSPGGDLLLVAGGAPAEHGSLELIRWPKGERVHADTLHKDLIYGVSWRSDGKQFVTASADHTCRVVEVPSGKVSQTLKGHSRPVLAVSFLPDGKKFVSAGIDQTLRVWEASTGESLRSLDNHLGTVHALALRPTTDPEARPMIASGSADRTLRLWQPTIGRLVRFARLPVPVLTSAWTPDGSRLLVGGPDGRVRLLDPDTVKVVREVDVLSGWIYRIAVAPSGKEALVAGEGGEVKRVVLQE